MCVGVPKFAGFGRTCLKMQDSGIRYVHALAWHFKAELDKYMYMHTFTNVDIPLILICIYL